MITFNSEDNLTICDTENGFMVVQSIWHLHLPTSHKQFVFRNTEELCEWIKEFYKEKP